MEAIQHSHLMQTIGVISGDDEMMDSDYDHVVQQDDDYDIELDGGEVYSNAGDDEMKFDMGDDTVTYDNDDLMLDEGEYQATVAQEEMIITEVQPVSAAYEGIDMSSGVATEIITQTSSSGDVADTHILTQDGTQGTNTDPFILSNQAPDVIVEVPNSPVVEHAIQELHEITHEITPVVEDNVQLSEDNVQLSEDTETVTAAEETVQSTDDKETAPDQADVTSNENVQSEVASGSDAQLESHIPGADSTFNVEKIHPIIVQFETNTLALFNSEYYINYTSTLDSSETTYPDVPSVFLLQDISYYSKGFDELFGGLREMFAATIGEDAEITMEFEALEIFLHEDNLLSKSVSLSDLMDLHIRLSKQDSIERPDPLYIVLSTQARFTKRYSELLTAAGEGKGLSQVCTYSPTNEFPTDGNTVGPSEEDITVDENSGVLEDQPANSIPAVITVQSAQNVETLSTASEPGVVSVEGKEQDTTETVPETQLGQETNQGGNDIEQPAVDMDNEEEEELLPADDEQYAEDSTSAHLENVTDKQPTTTTYPINTSARELSVEEVPNEVVTETQFAAKVVEPEAQQTGGSYQLPKETEDRGTESVVQETLGQDEFADEEASADEDYLDEAEVPAEEDIPAAATEEEQVGYVEESDEAVGGISELGDNIDETEEELKEYEEEDYKSHPETPNNDEITEDEQDPSREGGYTEESEEEQHESVPTHPHGEDAPSQHDDESFSSATVVEVQDANSPAEYEETSLSGTACTQSPHREDIDQHQQIQAHQLYEIEAHISDEFETVEVQEYRNDETYDGGEAYTYESGEWQDGQAGELFQQEYYTGEVDPEDYIDAQFGGDPRIGFVHGENTSNDPAGGRYDDSGDATNSEGFTYPDGDDAEGYEDYQEEIIDPHPAAHGTSPTGKRLREEEGDVFDSQDIKRNRSN